MSLSRSVVKQGGFFCFREHRSLSLFFSLSISQHPHPRTSPHHNSHIRLLQHSSQHRISLLSHWLSCPGFLFYSAILFVNRFTSFGNIPLLFVIKYYIRYYNLY